ncbi:2TM domain-containing protein [Ammoniphilus sp. CFH 90114]|uniref:2TM domain-containing protein n=1 Tax=Ammoniphilus sp. CFH 90114 TaxID=2493665 RepID=UPI001F0C42B8|nr:2TM domain-containing protein [Ammoniphilus sp. CFH 90114]
MESEKYIEAKKKVARIKSFYIHLIIYILVNALLFGIDMLDDSSNYWFYWPLLGWGIGLTVHGLSVYALGGLFSREWEEKKIREIMEKDQGK